MYSNSTLGRIKIKVLTYDIDGGHDETGREYLTIMTQNKSKQSFTKGQKKD